MISYKRPTSSTRDGIEQLGNSFGSIFLVVGIMPIVTWSNPQPSDLSESSVNAKVLSILFTNRAHKPPYKDPTV